MKNGLHLPGDTDIYAITAEKFSCGRSNVDVVGDILKSDVKIIQYREKEKSMREKYAECTILRKMTADFNATFIIDDDVDLMLAVGADGVHIGQDDLPIDAVRRIVGDKIIGLSTHSPNQALKAVQSGADYIGVGPIFSTQTKVNVCDAVGIEYLDFVVKNYNIPFTAIGGIKLANLEEVAKHKAKCVCMVTEIVGAEDISAVIRDARLKMKAVGY